MALRMLLAIAKSFVTQPGMIELFVLTISDVCEAEAPARSMYVNRYDGVVNLMAERLESDRVQGLINATIDAHVIARQCVAMLDGLQLQWVIAENGIDIVSLMTDYLEQVSTTLSPSGSRAVLG